MTDTVKIALSNGKLQFIVAALAIAAFFWQVATTVNSQEFRTAAVERKIESIEVEQKEFREQSSLMNEKLLGRIDTLNERITELAIAIKGGAATSGK